MSTDDSPRHIEADDLHETHATNFQLTANEKEVILSFGEMNLEIQADGSSDATEIVYDTKVRMDHQTVGELLQMLQANIDLEEPEADASDDRHIH